MNKKPVALFIEDDSYLSEIYTQHFAGHKIQTKAVKNFVEADKKIKRGLPEVVVVDIALEEKSGLSWIRNFKNNGNTKNIPVVVMTGLGDRQSIQEAIEAGACRYFLKSQITPCELAKKISELII
jgi:DNA-binding response OmpR family regulator